MISRAVFALILMASALPVLAQPASPAEEGAQRKAYSRDRPSDWPCMQRKVEKLSPGAFWSGPPIDPETDWRDDEAVAKLVPALVSRRVSLDDAGKMIERFAKENEADKDKKLTLLFTGVYSELNNLRSDVIRGIGRFVKNQRAKSEQLIKARDELEALQAKPDKSEDDLKRVGELEIQVQWLQRIYQDRESTTRYICEVPTLLEQRIFAIARLIQAQMTPTH